MKMEPEDHQITTWDLLTDKAQVGQAKAQTEAGSTGVRRGDSRRVGGEDQVVRDRTTMETPGPTEEDQEDSGRTRNASLPMMGITVDMTGTHSRFHTLECLGGCYSASEKLKTSLATSK